MNKKSLQELLAKIRAEHPTAFPISDLIDAVRTKDDLEHFVSFLLKSNPESWHNSDLADYLSAMQGVISGLDGYYRNMGERPPEEPRWKDIAHILYTSSIYD
jgi:hypothetical protein